MRFDSIQFATIWPFASGWMLLWSLAAVIPLLIYYWRKQHLQKVTWAATRLVRAAAQHQSRRFNVLHWLLLALRIAILIVLAVAVAGPFQLHDTRVEKQSQFPRKHIVLVFDISFSMSYVDGGQSLLERCRSKAFELIDESRTGDGFSMVVMDESPEQITRQIAYHKPAIRNAIRQVQLSQEKANSQAAIQSVLSLLKAAQVEGEFDESEVWIFSDLAANTWKTVEAATPLEGLESPASRPAADLMQSARVKIFPPALKERTNVAVTGLSFYPTTILPNQNFTLTATIETFGLNVDQQAKVELWKGDSLVDAKNVQIQWKRPTTVSFQSSIEFSGYHNYSVRVANDSLPIDNARHVIAVVRDSLRVLCVENQPGEAFNVAAALMPDETGDQTVQVTSTVGATWTNRDLSSFDCILFCNIPRFQKSERQLISEFLDQGRGVVFFLGDQVDIDAYNSVFGAVDDSTPLPVKLDSVAATGTYRLDPVNYEHPIVAPFRGFEQSGLLSIPIWKYIRFQPSSQDGIRVAMKFQNGDPAVVTFQIGNGRTVLYASSVTSLAAGESEWSAIEGWWSFPPLLNEMVLWVTSRDAQNERRTVGENVSLVRPIANITDRLQVVGPDGSAIPFSQVNADATQELVFGPASASGVYKIQELDGRVSQLVAVNVDNAESDLRSLAIDRTLFGSGRADAPLAANRAETERGQRFLFQYLLAFLLLLMIGESVLAWRLGRRRKSLSSSMP